MNRLLYIVFLTLLSSCGQWQKQNENSSGDASFANYRYVRPKNMVYIPTGTFHMGASDEDINYLQTARNMQVSIVNFYMDKTEITNAQYHDFTKYVFDSIAAVQLGYTKANSFGVVEIDWKKYRKSQKIKTFAASLISTDLYFQEQKDKIFKQPEIDVSKLIYVSERLDLKKAAISKEKDKRRRNFIITFRTPIYPDTLVWVRDFSYSYNEPMMKRYFSHPSYSDYPVVGINWYQANAYCDWRTENLYQYTSQRKIADKGSFRLPTEAEWEYAARGGRSQAMYPWGGPYLRNKKGQFLANFKPGRGNYPDDGGFYTVSAYSYYPNDYGLYNMSGNVSEWTSTMYYSSGYNYQSDFNSSIEHYAFSNENITMKRKVIRGGSWKDVAYYLQNGTRNYEYQDSSKSYIGFRCVLDFTPIEHSNFKR